MHTVAHAMHINCSEVTKGDEWSQSTHFRHNTDDPLYLTKLCTDTRHTQIRFRLGNTVKL
jgi:hypothetical protein